MSGSARKGGPNFWRGREASHLNKSKYTSCSKKLSFLNYSGQAGRVVFPVFKFLFRHFSTVGFHFILAEHFDDVVSEVVLQVVFVVIGLDELDWRVVGVVLRYGIVGAVFVIWVLIVRVGLEVFGTAALVTAVAQAVLIAASVLSTDELSSSNLSTVVFLAMVIPATVIPAMVVPTYILCLPPTLLKRKSHTLLKIFCWSVSAPIMQRRKVSWFLNGISDVELTYPIQFFTLQTYPFAWVVQ